MTYKSFKELNGKTLKEHDCVLIANRSYYVHSRFLVAAAGKNNDQPFRDLIEKYPQFSRAYTSTVKEFLAEKAYGYKEKGGQWPESKFEDYEALTRLVLVLYSFFENLEPVQVLIKKKWVTIDLDKHVPYVLGTKVGDYEAQIKIRQKIVTVGCQDIPFSQIDKLYELMYSEEDPSTVNT